jgi:hypothetical protein
MRNETIGVVGMMPPKQAASLGAKVNYLCSAVCAARLRRAKLVKEMLRL